MEKKASVVDVYIRRVRENLPKVKCCLLRNDYDHANKRVPQALSVCLGGSTFLLDILCGKVLNACPFDWFEKATVVVVQFNAKFISIVLTPF